MAGERQQHVSPIDVSYDDWDHLLAPFESPALSPETANNGSDERQKTEGATAKITQLFPNDPSKPKCLWCGKPFTPGRHNQKFCTPNKERGLNFKRRQALTKAVAEQFKRWNWSTRTGSLESVAKKCIDADYEAMMKAMQKLGWNYNAKSCQWSLIKGS